MSKKVANKRQRLIVFTDLDGTLLDHHSYTLEKSRAAVEQLGELGIPLVFCSSKTFSEQVHLQREAGICQPFIFENGSAIAIPVGYFAKQYCTDAKRVEGYDLIAFSNATSDSIGSVLKDFSHLKGYSRTADTELAAATGLVGDALQRARERWFTETLVTALEPAQAEEINDRLAHSGLLLSRGGRFYTVQSAAVDKGKAVRQMMTLFRQDSRVTMVFAGIGDSLNDLPMLEAVDLPFLVQNPDRQWAPINIPKLIKVPEVGPEGFSTAIQTLLES